MGNIVNPELDFEKRHRLVREIIETIILTALMFLVIRFAVQNYYVEGVSMEPNLHNQERILIDKWTYLFHAPMRGDIIIFIAPDDHTQDYVKRIIGIPGDVITINDTTVIVDGVTLQETYIDPRRQGNQYQYKQISNLVVPPNDYFVLGDNRVISSDSRNWGFVPRANIIGRAAIVYWPFGEDNDGFIPNVSSVFNNVHQTGVAPDTQYQSGTLDMDGVLLVFMPGILLARSRQRGKGSGRNRDSWRERRTHQQI
jgi:signal peptidase I